MTRTNTNRIVMESSDPMESPDAMKSFSQLQFAFAHLSSASSSPTRGWRGNTPTIYVTSTSNHQSVLSRKPCHSCRAANVVSWSVFTTSQSELTSQSRQFNLQLKDIGHVNVIPSSLGVLAIQQRRVFVGAILTVAETNAMLSVDHPSCHS